MKAALKVNLTGLIIDNRRPYAHFKSLNKIYILQQGQSYPCMNTKGFPFCIIVLGHFVLVLCQESNSRFVIRIWDLSLVLLLARNNENHWQPKAKDMRQQKVIVKTQ